MCICSVVRGLSCKPKIYLSWPTSELRVRLVPWNRLKPSSKIFYWPFQGDTNLLWIISVIYVLCFSCFCVCSLLHCGHLIGKGWIYGSSLWCVIVFLSLSHVVFWVRCGFWLIRFLIFATFITLDRLPSVQTRRSFCCYSSTCDKCCKILMFGVFYTTLLAV